jgi:hypothetical protein
MVVCSTAFALWSIYDGTALVVNASLIAGVSWVTNVGAWWPGLFAAMVALTIVAAVWSPAFLRSIEDELSSVSVGPDSEARADDVRSLSAP